MTNRMNQQIRHQMEWDCQCVVMYAVDILHLLVTKIHAWKQQDKYRINVYQ